ncbi:MAG: fasciclin domain-containing protein [Marinilabiliaceae bacterium]|nr:fasciclin domain-containing protein [Marinilabiliaceae bacterium]
MKKSFLKFIIQFAKNTIRSFGLFLTGICMVFIVSCVDDDVPNEYVTTFTEDLIGQHLQKNPEDYSEFVKLLQKTNVLGLLNAYGEYTVFAPTNEAMFAFYADNGKDSLGAFPADTLLKIAYDHIIKDNEISSEDFNNGRLASMTMSQRYISLEFESYSNIFVNKISKITELDIEVHNGYIHKINKVLKPTDLTVVGSLEADSIFTIFVNALKYTKLNSKLMAIEDTTYNIDDYDYYKIEQANGQTEELPRYRKFGYTILAESDSTFKANGINSFDDLKAYAKSVYDQVFPADANITDITDPRNSLNRFMSYHLFDRQIGYRKFVMDYDATGHQFQGQGVYDMYECIETMCENTIVEVRTDKQNNRTNLFNWDMESNTGVKIVSTNYDNDGVNGVYHEIDNILVYDVRFASYISGKRLRMDAASFFPELINNNMRANGELHRYIIPPGYFEGLTFSEKTKFTYLNADHRYEDYQGDEMFLKGLYEFSIITPPVPAGQYEVRFSFQPTAFRGVAQLYWDNLPCGIPIDLSINADDASIGHEVPGSNLDDPYGYENDKMMRNRGFMKGPASYRSVDKIWYKADNARKSTQSIRVILGIYEFEEMKKHKFSVTGYKNGEFMLDFLEFVPVEALEYEDIY